MAKNGKEGVPKAGAAAPKPTQVSPAEPQPPPPPTMGSNLAKPAVDPQAPGHSILHTGGQYNPSIHTKFNAPVGRNKSMDSLMSKGSVAAMSQRSDTSMDYLARSAKMSRLSEIVLGGPRNAGSLVVRWRKHLTYKPDRAYFTGRAGVVRLVTLVIVVGSTCLGLPGFSTTSNLKKGYGEAWIIKLSIAIMTCVAVIQTVFIFLLLSYREVRCQTTWDDWNSWWHAVCSFICCIAGLMELLGIFETRALNCKENVKLICITLQDKYVPDGHPGSLSMPYKNWHYAACIGRFVAAILFSISSRIWLKNDIEADYM